MTIIEETKQFFEDTEEKIAQLTRALRTAQKTNWNDYWERNALIDRLNITHSIIKDIIKKNALH